MLGVPLKKAGVALLAAPVLGVLIPPAVRAQDAPGTLPPVRVEGEAIPRSTADGYAVPTATSATKTNTPVIDTPQSVTTIPRRQLDDQNPQTVRDALNYTPGVLSGIDATNRYDSVFMRGFGGFGLSTEVVDFLDGLKLPRGQAFALPSVDPFLLDRIDVLRGPSALLYGQTSPGGLVNQISRAPSARPYNEARIEGGSYGRVQGGFTSQGALDEGGIWRYSFSAIGRAAGTRYDDVDERRLGVAPALTWAPSADTRLTLQGFYQTDPKGGYFNSIYPRSLAPAPFGGHLDRNFNVGDPTFDRYKRKQYALGYSFEHRFNDVVSLASTLRYAAIDLDLQGIQMAAPVTGGGILPRQAARSIEDVGGIATDNHAQINFATGSVNHQALVGVDFQHAVSNWDYRFGAAPPLDVTNPLYGVAIGPLARVIDNRQTLRQIGVYVQDQLSLGGLRVVLGVRYDWTEQTTENH